MNEIEESKVESQESRVEEQKTNDINLTGNAIAHNPTDVLINNPEKTDEEENFITIDDFLKISKFISDVDFSKIFKAS